MPIADPDRVMSLFGIAIASALALSLGCGSPPKWESAASPNARDLDWIAPGLADEDVPAFERAEVPDIPAKTALRPCCAFGHDLQVRAGFVPVPGFSVGNLKGVEDLGHHNFDAGVLTRKRRSGALRSENNGQVYTCRGGFIDTAHVRDYADWTLFMTAALLRAEGPRAVIELPDEGGMRRVLLAGRFFELIEAEGWESAVPLAQWLAFQLSIWHEIIQWYGYSEVPTYPEKISAFSPEDLYSNLLGTRIAGGIIYAYLADSEILYNESMNLWLASVLERLGALSREDGAAAIREVDGLWWDSSKRLPDWDLVLRRHFEVGPELDGWLVSDVATSPEGVAMLERQCGKDLEPLRIPNQTELDDIPFRDLATLEIEVDAKLAQGFPFPRPDSRRITQEDFPSIIEATRLENLEQAGPAADRPGR